MYCTLLLVGLDILLWLPVFARATTVCPACDSLRARWNPHGNTGSCVINVSDPVQYIVAFEQCICSPGSQSDYATCAKCNVNGDGGVPIDGLNFGAASQFSSACSVFAKDVTSVLQPSGLNAFASVVAPIITSSTRAQIASADVLGFYALQNVVTASHAISGIMTDSTAPRATGTSRPTGTIAVKSTQSSTLAATSGSKSCSPVPAISVVLLLALLVVALL